MHQIRLTIWKTDQWAADASRTTPAKRSAQTTRTNYRTIALLSYASKIILNTILQTIHLKNDKQLTIEQAAFPRG